MECVRSSPVKSWQGGVQWGRASIDDNTIVPHSAPSTCSLFSSSCRRAASFPMAHATALPSALKVRSQSESAGLNTLHIKVPRCVFAEIQNNMLQNGEFFTNGQELIHSDSDGDDSSTSADSGHTSEDEHPTTEFNDSSPNEDSFSDHNCSLIPLKKKKVRFADDCGCVLESVRVMTEPSDIPPKISPSIIRRYRRGSKAFLRAQHAKTNSSGVLSNDEDSSEDDVDDMYHNKKHASWKIGFTQPASEHVKFRETLEKQKVALENVMLRNDHCKMLGTIKVANIAFEKHVFIRYSFDNWKSYLDRPAVYQASPSKLYDIFGFEIEIPMNEGDINKIDFCICYNAGGVEYWDSNCGKNYSLISANQPAKPAQIVSQHHRRNSDCDDAYKMTYDSWSRFASWRDLSTDAPYCYLEKQICYFATGQVQCLYKFSCVFTVLLIYFFGFLPYRKMMNT
uniref:CBM21 domain-containing protein n=1 Tax=Panagrolaimus sp. JU765 TaxID=591449 RepID=A0AC34RES6_9BILA